MNKTQIISLMVFLLLVVNRNSMVNGLLTVNNDSSFSDK